MTLKEFNMIALSNYFVGVNKDFKCIDEFYNTDKTNLEYYGNCLVSSVHVLNENMLAVNIELD